MRKFRQYVATTLIVAMMGSTMSIPAMADEVSSEEGGGGKLHWVLEDGNWYFYKRDGNLRKDQYWYMDREETWYGFNEDGRMYENELVYDTRLDYIGEADELTDEKVPVYFAHPGGRLARDKRWILLNDDDGSLHVHGDSCGVDCDLETSWYNFKKEDISTDLHKIDAGITPAYNLGRIVVGEEFKDASGKSYFGFDQQGKMFSRKWVLWRDGAIVQVLDPEKGEAPEDPFEEGGAWHFYRYQGELVTKKIFPVGGLWYQFDDKGDWTGWTGEPAPATPANAENGWLEPDEWMVHSVKYVGEKTGEDADVVALPGETVNLEFKVTLASDSNAESVTPRLKKSKHDIWVSDAKRGRVEEITVNETAATCTIEYVTGEAYIGTEELALCIDGRDIKDTVTIKTKAATTRMEASKSVDNILKALDNDDPNVTASMLKDSLAAVYTGGEEEPSNPVIQEEIKRNLVNNQANLKKLSAQYAAEKFINEGEPVIDDEVKTLLPDGGSAVEVAGSALNADPGTTVELKVAKGSAEAEEKIPVGENKTRIALDIVLQTRAADADEAEPISGQLKIPVVITISIPAGLKASSVELWHVHDDGDPEKVESAKRSGNRITFAADKFSDYVFVGDPDDGSGQNPNPERPWTGGSSDSDGGSSSSSQGSGQWILDAIGWWYRNPDGSYPFNTWHQLMYNSRMDWYHFNQEGYINTGWFTDLDGRRYYLNPLSNGYKGALLTGWQQIDGFWYYFNQESDGYKGALLTSTETPDGYRVNEKGQRIQ